MRYSNKNMRQSVFDCRSYPARERYLPAGACLLAGGCYPPYNGKANQNVLPLPTVLSTP